MDLKNVKFIFLLNIFAVLSLSTFAQNKPDALKLYRNGRNLDLVGRRVDAKIAYQKAVDICMDELKENSKNMESYAVLTWSLFRLARYKEAEKNCYDALKIKNDTRILETLAETQFYLRNYSASLKNMQTYIDMAPGGERISVAHFFVGEIYRISKKFSKADIAYSIAVHLDPGNALWWYRLGLVRESIGQKNYALDAYNRALKLFPNYKDALDAVKRIKI